VLEALPHRRWAALEGHQDPPPFGRSRPSGRQPRRKAAAPAHLGHDEGLQPRRLSRYRVREGSVVPR